MNQIGKNKIPYSRKYPWQVLTTPRTSTQIRVDLWSQVTWTREFHTHGYTCSEPRVTRTHAQPYHLMIYMNFITFVTPMVSGTLWPPFQATKIQETCRGSWHWPSDSYCQPVHPQCPVSYGGTQHMSTAWQQRMRLTALPIIPSHCAPFSAHRP